MIQTDKLINAVGDRMRIWAFSDIYSTAEKAKEAAAKLFIKETGVTVKQIGSKSFVVLHWHPKREEI